ncbi:DUF4365 domain-containing protein [Jannaschia sp. R86511]|uniref:DUF4365 domain-containing protein n=1 Tax=Jannaschia sp. R86511 TaxID=3093853 RepID=UPI0036D42B55
MRATPGQVMGAAGQTAVKLAFEQLGWGAVDNDRHDLGIDLFVQPREQTGVDLGQMVGVQVKTGTSWFQRPQQDASGHVTGWWWADEDRRHVDHWLRSAYSVLLVLHHPGDHRSYWVHVTPETVESTGRGVKMLVPAQQVISPSDSSALLGVAGAAPAARGWEGSAWDAGRRIATVDSWRHALIAPRLLAPHRNRSVNALTPVQALALVTQVRLRDLAFAADRSEAVPPMEEARDHPDWDWRFVAALRHRVTTGEPDLLLRLLPGAPTPERLAAAAVSSAMAYLEEGRPEAGADVLSPLLDVEGLTPIDRAWMRMQMARALADHGEVSDARQLAHDLIGLRLSHPHDVTAGAISAAATSLVYRTASFHKTDVEQVIRHQDTVTAWWRSQTLAHGLTAQLEGTLRQWSRDGSTVHHFEDPVEVPLFTVMLTASGAGDHYGWQHYAGLLAAHRAVTLTRDSDVDTTVTVLSDLRLSGSTAELKMVAGRLLRDGPCLAVAASAEKVDLGLSTATSLQADLMLLEIGGDVLAAAVADRHATDLLQLLRNEAPTRQRCTPRFLLTREGIRALTAVVPSSSPEVQEAAAEHLAQLAPVEDQSLAEAWRDLAGALPDKVWDHDRASRCASASHHPRLRTPLLGLLARHDQDVRQSLVRSAIDGDADALSAVGPVTTLETEDARRLVDVLTARVQATVQRARANSRSGGGVDQVYVLALINRWHPEAASWEPVLEALAEPRVAADDKHRALRYLAIIADDLPSDVRAALVLTARAAAGAAPSPLDGHALFGGGPPPDVRGAALLLHHAVVAGSDAVDAGERQDLFTHLLDRAGEGRLTDVAHLAGSVGQQGGAELLACLSQASDPDVRAAAVHGMARRWAEGDRSDIVRQSLRRAVDDGGRVVPLTLARVLGAGSGTVDDDTAGLLRPLAHHPSHKVRGAAFDGLP